MTRMNAGIILSGQAPDIAGSVAKGIQNAGMFNAVSDQNALRSLYADQGANILAGDQNALNSLAGLNPQAAMDMRTAQAAEARAAKGFEVEMEEYARSLDAAERARQAAAIEQGLVKATQLYQAGDLRGLNMMLAEVGQNPIRDLGEFPAIAAQYEQAWTVLDRMKEFNAPPKPADEYGRYVAEERAAGREPLDRIGYAQAKRGRGTVVYDPTTGRPLVSIGGGEVGAIEPSSPDAMLGTIDGILSDPALDSSTGVYSFLQAIPGTPQRRFGARAAQLEGQAFLQAFESLKGGGQITEIEGQKATQAIGRLDTAQSAADYRAALEELRDILLTAKSRSTGQPVPEVPTAETEPEGDNPYSNLSDEEFNALDINELTPEQIKQLAAARGLK